MMQCVKYLEVKNIGKNEKIVLCEILNNNFSSYLMWLENEKYKKCWGRYFTDKEKAYQIFKKRYKEYLNWRS